MGTRRDPASPLWWEIITYVRYTLRGQCRVRGSVPEPTRAQRGARADRSHPRRANYQRYRPCVAPSPAGRTLLNGKHELRRRRCRRYGRHGADSSPERPWRNRKDNNPAARQARSLERLVPQSSLMGNRRCATLAPPILRLAAFARGSRFRRDGTCLKEDILASFPRPKMPTQWENLHVSSGVALSRALSLSLTLPAGKVRAR